MLIILTYFFTVQYIIKLDRCKNLSCAQGSRKVILGEFIMNMKYVASDVVLRLGTMLETVIPRILAFWVLKNAYVQLVYNPRMSFIKKRLATPILCEAAPKSISTTNIYLSMGCLPP